MSIKTKKHRVGRPKEKARSGITHPACINPSPPKPVNTTTKGSIIASPIITAHIFIISLNTKTL